MKPERQPALFEPDGVGDHGVARSASDSFANTICKANREHLVPVTGKRKKRSHQRRKRIAADYQELPSSKSIAEIAGKEFQQTGNGFGQSFNDADRACGCA